MFNTRLSPAQELVFVHIGFNLMLVLLGIPICRQMDGLLRRLVPDQLASQSAPKPTYHRSALDRSVLDRPAAALASLRREVLRMQQIVEEMMIPAMGLYDDFDRGRMKDIRATDQLVNEAFDAVRRYAADIVSANISKTEEKEMRELLEVAIAFEAAGDIVAKSLMPLAEEKDREQIRFSKDGAKELRKMHERVLQNLDLAGRVLISNDAESARLLLLEKDEMRRLHRTSRKAHLRRLSAGEQVSLDSSDIHLETASALKEFNAQIASVAYPILFRKGQLLDTRLITKMDQEYEGG